MALFGILSSFVNPFTSKTARPRTGFGRVALETTKAPQRPGSEYLSSQPKELTSEQEAAVFSRDDVDSFVHFGQPLKMKSSNVDEIRYNPEQSQLTITFKNGNTYQYENVSIREAEVFARAASPGGWVWDALRVRGSVFGYRKAYTLLSVASSGKMPQWFRSAKARRAHGAVGPEGTRSKKQFRFLAPKWNRKVTR